MASNGVLKAERPAAVDAYDLAEEEPNFALAVECVRQAGVKWPHSRWRVEGRVEGRSLAGMSRKQRDYVAASLRHIADRIDEYDSRAVAQEQVVRGARRLYLSARLALTELTDHIYHLVEHRGEAETASLLGLKLTQIQRIARGGFKDLLYELPAVPGRDYGGRRPEAQLYERVYGGKGRKRLRQSV